MRTWVYELLVVGTLLIVTTLLTSPTLVGWLTVGAVLLSFCYTQVASRMAEKEGQRPIPSVECHWKLKWYFIGKETWWVAVFIAAQNYAALVGCGVFLLYPAWRTLYRRYDES